MLSSTQKYRDMLTKTLIEEGDISSEQVKAAFLVVPRHLFVSSYYERQGNSWIQHQPPDGENWHQQIYSNRAFITLMDEAGRVLSSSSQPGVMARMLELLDVHPGQRILEVGAGTGYNAALLARITGKSGRIVTVDIEKDVTDQARDNLHAASYEYVQVVQADGSQGYAPAAPYDRIIATCSTPSVPPAWLQQLAPDGVLVCVIQPGLSSSGGLLKATKKEGELAGRIVQDCTFMPLHSASFRYQPRNIPVIDMELPVLAAFAYQRGLFDTSVIWTPEFQFFLYFSLPALRIVEQQRPPDERGYFLFLDTQMPETYVFLSQDQHPMQAELRGEQAPFLWLRLVQAYTLWNACGQPAIADYWFTMNAKGRQRIYLKSDKGMLWPFI